MAKTLNRLDLADRIDKAANTVQRRGDVRIALALREVRNELTREERDAEKAKLEAKHEETRRRKEEARRARKEAQANDSKSGRKG